MSALVGGRGGVFIDSAGVGLKVGVASDGNSEGAVVVDGVLEVVFAGKDTLCLVEHGGVVVSVSRRAGVGHGTAGSSVSAVGTFG